jgi:hypothetical protein
MLSSRRFARHSAAALILVSAAGLSGLAAHAESASAAAPSTAESCENPQEPRAELPPGVEDGDLLFVTKYHPILVQITCGRLELVELTGWDSCYFLHEDEVIRYPC